MKKLFVSLLFLATAAIADAQTPESKSGALTPEQKKERRDARKEDAQQLKSDLQLNAEQELKMKEANREMADQLKKIRDNEQLTKEEKMAQMKAAREAHQSKLNSFLSEQQIEKYRAFQRSQMQERRQQRKG